MEAIDNVIRLFRVERYDEKRFVVRLCGVIDSFLNFSVQQPSSLLGSLARVSVEQSLRRDSALVNNLVIIRCKALSFRVVI